MQSSLNIFVEAIRQLIYQMAEIFPKVVIALIIWWVGNRFLMIGLDLLKKVNIKGTKLDEQIIGVFSKITLPLGKFILVLIVLDYLGIGRTVISAFMNGLTLAVSIALGLAFGKALEKDAGEIVSEVRKQLKK
ncbi:MAG: hypothetical protein JW991_03950 [Candidatus Pacebacteria bacterium]|nr:hypothetical protein [Candidatus Paceibacterota bacterium]